VVLAYDEAGAERRQRATKSRRSSRPTTRARAALDFLAAHPACTGKLGAIGSASGGTSRSAPRSTPTRGAAVCFYATGHPQRSLGKG